MREPRTEAGASQKQGGREAWRKRSPSWEAEKVEDLRREGDGGRGGRSGRGAADLREGRIGNQSSVRGGQQAEEELWRAALLIDEPYLPLPSLLGGGKGTELERTGGILPAGGLHLEDAVHLRHVHGHPSLQCRYVALQASADSIRDDREPVLMAQLHSCSDLFRGPGVDDCLRRRAPEGVPGADDLVRDREAEDC